MMERKPLEEERGKISVSVVHSRSLPRTHLSSGGMADVFSSSWKEEKEAILIDSDDEALLISGCDDIKTVEEFSSPRVTWCLDTPSGHHHTKEEESSHTADKFPDDGGGVQIECGFSHRQNESNEEESDLFFPFDDEEEIEWLSGEEEEEDVQTTTQLRRQRRTRRYFLWNSTERKFEETSQYDGGTPYPSHETINKNDDAPLSVSASPSELSNEFSATTREQKNTAHLPHPHSSSSSLASSSSSSSASSSSSLLPKSLRHTFSDTEQHLSSSPSSSSLLVAIPGFGVHVKGLPSWFALPLTHPRTPEAVRDLWRRVTRDLQAYQTFSLSPHTPGDSADKKDRREEETQSCLSSSPSSSPQSSSFFCVAQGSRDKTGCNEGGEKDNHSRLSPSMDSPEGGEKENERDNREKEDVCCLPWKPTCALEKAGYPSWVYLSSDVTFPSPEHANELWGQIARDVHTLRLEKKRRLRQRNATIASREERESVINRTEENKKRRSGEGESVSKRGNDGGCEEVKSSHVRMKTCHTMDQAKERADDYVNEKQPCIIITGEKNRTLLQQEKQADGSARGVYTPGGNNMLSNCTNPLQQSSKKAGSSEFVSKLLVRSKPLSSFLSHTNKKTGFSFSGSSMLKATAGGRDLPATSLRKADAPTTEGSVERRKAFLRSREEENGEGHISSSLQKKQKTGTSLSYLISDPTARQTASAKLPQKPRPGGQGNGAVTKKQNGGEVDKRDVKGNSTNSRHGGGVYVPLAERLRPA
ncbi:werner helicase interacting protein 1, partial [Cystoisospora suis]